MAQEIYNEGRVVGFSAWEIFMREALNNGVPQSDIPDEHKWLASMIGSGASMILRIPANTTAGVHDYELPLNSNLAAAGVILANPFMGECEWDSSTWATKITSYSPLILNNSFEYPTSNDVPYDSDYTHAEYKNSVSEFVKITDGIVYTKNATWLNTESGLPQEDINPNFNESSTVVRLYISEDIKYDVKILLTGFHNKRILQAVSGYATADGSYCIGGSTDTVHNDWPDGGMIGPEIMPWACKIIFSVPSSSYNLATSLSRTIPSDTAYTDTVVDDKYTFRNVTDSTIKPNSIIDFNSINITDYYDNHTYSTSPTLSENVTGVTLGLNDSCNTIVAWYPGMTAANIKAADLASDTSNFFPPAIYAAQVTETGSQTLVPLDVAAPGTIKGFEDSTEAYNYKTLLPNNYAIYHDSVKNTFSFVTSSDPSEWSGTTKLDYLSGDYPAAKLTVGTQEAKIIVLNDSTNTDYDLVGTNGTVAVGPENYLTWDSMLKALKAGKSVNVLGDKLKAFGTELKNSNTIGITNATTNIGSAKFTITGSNPVGITSSVNKTTKLATLDSGTSLKSGTNFIEFSNGLRIYISNSNPGNTNVPEGSIGIGW